jgi:hypothetical protein
VLRQGVFLALFGILGTGGSASGQTKISDNPQLIVSVYNDAGIPASVLLRAQQEVVKVFRAAGVQVEWTGPRISVDSAVSGVPRELAVRIVPRSRNLSAEIFGVAFLAPDGGGKQADVFYDNVATFSRESARNSGVVLGCVMAHELGHLVLGSNAHSTVGLMRPRWDSEELKKMSIGQLRFEPSQTMQVRSRLEQAAVNRPSTVLRAEVSSKFPVR